MRDIIPLFSTTASRKEGSLFTVEKAGANAKQGLIHGPISLCDLAKADGMKRLYLVESTMINFHSAFKNLKEVGCELVFGLKVVVCADMADKSEASLKTESKVIVFVNDTSPAGYQALIKLFTRAAAEGFYYVPRLDWKALKSGWADTLALALPFYSSFLAKNTLTFATITPDLPARPIVLMESNNLPYDGLLDDAVVRYCAAERLLPQAAQSIYYRTPADVRPFVVYRSILDRGRSYDKPPEGLWSSAFNLLHWKDMTVSVPRSTVTVS